MQINPKIIWRQLLCELNFLDGGAAVPPVDAGRRVIINLRALFRVNGFILVDSAEYNSQVQILGPSTENIQLEANRLYEVQGTKDLVQQIRVFRMPMQHLLKTIQA